MKVKFVYLVLFSILFIFSCDPKKKENEKLKDEVIAIHDEVMPFMGELQSFQKDLMMEAAELSQKDHDLHQKEIIKLENTAKELEDAYNGMFVWMRQFEVEPEEMTEEEISKYLKEQKEQVEKVNTDIKKALEKAESVKN